MKALDSYVDAYRNTNIGDRVPVDKKTYFEAMEEFDALVAAHDPRATQAYNYAEHEVDHDLEVDHRHSGNESAEIMSKAILAYAGSIENGWGAGNVMGTCLIDENDPKQWASVLLREDGKLAVVVNDGTVIGDDVVDARPALTVTVAGADYLAGLLRSTLAQLEG
jgi:hypothetical protein